MLIISVLCCIAWILHAVCMFSDVERGGGGFEEESAVLVDFLERKAREFRGIGNEEQNSGLWK